MMEQNFYNTVREAILNNSSLRKKLWRTVNYYRALEREGFAADSPQFTDEIYIKYSWLMGFLEYDEHQENERYLERLLLRTTDIIMFMDGFFETVEKWRLRNKKRKPREQRARKNDIKSLESALKVFDFLSLGGDTNPHFKSMANVYPTKGEYCLRDVYNGIVWLKEQIEAVNGNEKKTVSDSSYASHLHYCYNTPSYNKLEIAIKSFIRSFKKVTAISPNGEKEEIDHTIYIDEVMEDFTNQVIKYLQTTKLL
jgi:hypothetical protein